MSHLLDWDCSSEFGFYIIYAGSHCKAGKIQGESSRTEEKEGYWTVKGAEREVHGMTLLFLVIHSVCVALLHPPH